MSVDMMERLSFRESSPRCIVFNEDNHYIKNRGYYINPLKCFLALLISVLLAGAAGYLVYYYAGCRLIEVPQSINENHSNLTWNDLRLTTDIVPSLYRLNIKPNLDETHDNHTYEGTVWITFTTSLYMSRIDLNVKDLTISDDIILTSGSAPTTNMYKASANPSEDVEPSIHVGVILNTIRELHSEENDDVFISEDEEATTTDPLENVTATSEIISSVDTPAPQADVFETTPDIEYQQPATVKDSIKIQKHVANDTYEIHSIFLNSPIEPNVNYTIAISFSGQLNNGTTGFFWKRYVDFGVSKYLASTQLYPALARSLFPCFDEPRFKAQFDISVARKSNMKVTSNTAIKESIPADGDWIWDRFVTTPPILPSFVFITVSDFTKQEYRNAKESSLYLWSREEMTDHAINAAHTVTTLIEAHYEFLDMGAKEFSSGISIFNLIAIPDKFDHTGNSYGVINLRELDLFLDPDTISLKYGINAYKTISNQISHALFSTISFEAWSDIWLSQAATRYVSIFAINEAEPLIDIAKHVFGEMNDLMQIDAFTSVSPLAKEMIDPYRSRHADAHFAELKGIALLDMCKLILGNDTFHHALGLYLKNALSGTDQSMPLGLWSMLDEVKSNHSISQNDDVIMEDFIKPWLHQKGYPILHISINYTEGLATLTQEHFSRQAQMDYLWHIPITYTTSGSQEKWSQTVDAWMVKEREIEIAISIENSTDWILFNNLRTGYYRTNYDNDTWHRILNVYITSPNEFSEITRAQLIDDAFNLAFEEYISFDVPLNMTITLSSERSSLVLDTAVKNLLRVKNILSNGPSYGMFKHFMLSILSPVFDRLNNDKISVKEDMFLKPHVNEWCCKFGYGKCIAMAQSLMNNLLLQSLADNSIPVNLRENIYCTAIASSDSELWQAIYEEAINETLHSERIFLLKSLACTEEIWVLNRLFDRMLNSSEISATDTLTILSSFDSVHSSNVILRILKDNWRSICRKYQKFPTVLSSFINALDKLNHRDDLFQFKNFVYLNKHLLESISMTVTLVGEKIINNVRYKNKHSDTINSWLLAHHIY